MHRAPWWNVWGCVGLLSVVLWGVTGCIAVLSDQVRQQAEQTLTFEQLYARPEAYVGRTVILGGEILRVWNVPEATWLDVVHRPLNPEDQPMLTERGAGHFVVRYDRYLNPLTYTAGRVVTVAGRVLGAYTDTVGERADVAPLLAGVELYLWPQATGSKGSPSLWLWWESDPWYWRPGSWWLSDH